MSAEYASSGCSQRADHDVITIGIAKREFQGSSVWIHMGLFFESWRERASSRQGVGEICHTEEQNQPIARLSVIGAGQWRMLMGSPLVEAQQDGSIRVDDLAKIIVRGARFRLTEQRLIPLEAASHVSDPD